MPSQITGRTVFERTLVAVVMLWAIGVFVPAHTFLDPPRWAPFPDAAESWTRTGTSDAATFQDGITLRSDALVVNRLSFDVPFEPPAEEGRRLLLSGRIIERSPAEASSGTAALGIAFLTADGENVGYENLRSIPRRATTLERFSTVVDWPVGAATAQVSLHSRPGAPTFSLHEGSAEIVRPNVLYTLCLLLLGSVVAFALWSIVQFVRASGAARSMLLPGALAAAIVVGVTLSVRSLQPVVEPVLLLFENLFGIASGGAVFVVLKGGHALAFFLLTFVLLRRRRQLGVRRWHLVVFAALLAIGSEGLQTHIGDRGASGLDVLIDLAGVFAATALTRLIRPERRKKRRRRMPERRRSAHAGADTKALGTSTLPLPLFQLPDIDLGTVAPLRAAAPAFAAPAPDAAPTSERGRTSRRRRRRRRRSEQSAE